MFNSYLYYLDPFRSVFPKRRNKDVVHHETCPVCGKTLVNLYGRNNDITGKKEWRCRVCWEEYDANPPDKMRINGSISKTLRGCDPEKIKADSLIGKPIINRANGAQTVVGYINEVDLESDTWYADIEVRFKKAEENADE